MHEASAFSPAGITSFFEIRDRRPDGRPFEDLGHAGARGGGLVTSLGITTHVRLQQADKSRVYVKINGKAAPHAHTTIYAISKLLEVSREEYRVEIEHRVEVPIGAGYGASAAGALSAALAFSQAADLGMSVNQLGRVVHHAEIANGTGLGTVGPILTGGFVVTRKSGGPGIAVVDRISVSRNLRVISACFGPISTKTVLRSKRIRNRVNTLASETFRSLDRDFRPRNFMSASLEFAHGLGLMSPETARLVELMNDSGAIGATQNMVGQAVHAIAEKDRAQRILRAVTRAFPRIWARCCELDFAGARVL